MTFGRSFPGFWGQYRGIFGQNFTIVAVFALFLDPKVIWMPEIVVIYWLLIRFIIMKNYDLFALFTVTVSPFFANFGYFSSICLTSWPFLPSLLWVSGPLWPILVGCFSSIFGNSWPVSILNFGWIMCALLVGSFSGKTSRFGKFCCRSRKLRP